MTGIVSRDVRTEQAIAWGRSPAWIIAHIGGDRADIDRAILRMNAAVNNDDAAYRTASHPVGDYGDYEALIASIAAGTTRIPSGSQSPELAEAIRRLATAGYSDPSIGARTYRSAAAVRAFRLRHNIPPGQTVGRPADGYRHLFSAKRRAS